MTAFYLAARYGRRLELADYADQLRKLGHQVTSRWLEGQHQADELEVAAGGEVDQVPEIARRFAEEDVADVTFADVVVFFSEALPERPRQLPPADAVEEWRPVLNSKLGYMVSSFGRVRNGDGEEIQGKKSRGYLRVQPDGRDGSGVAIHALVAEAFIGPCPPGLEIDHVDGWKDNNWVGNLEYVEHVENVRRGEARGARGSRAGSDNGRSKLDLWDVVEIRARARAGESKASIARDFDVSDVMVGKISRGEAWPPSEHLLTRGGRHCEFGMALGWVLAGYRSLDGGRRQVVVIGQRENVFHCLREVAVFPDWASFVATVDPAPDVADPSDPAVRCSFCGEWVDIEDATHTLIRLTETGAVVACHDRCLAQDKEAVR